MRKTICTVMAKRDFARIGCKGEPSVGNEGILAIYWAVSYLKDKIAPSYALKRHFILFPCCIKCEVNRLVQLRTMLLVNFDILSHQVNFVKIYFNLPYQRTSFLVRSVHYIRIE